MTEASGTEIKPGELWDVFARTYLPDDRRDPADLHARSHPAEKEGPRWSPRSSSTVITGRSSGQGNGPVAALVNGLRAELGLEVSVEDYHEHALTAGSEASAVAYVQATGADGERTWGVGIDSSILDASLQAVISAANRLRDQARQRQGRLVSLCRCPPRSTPRPVVTSGSSTSVRSRPTGGSTPTSATAT